MKKSEKVVPVSEQVYLLNIVTGIAMLATGIVSYFNHPFCSFITIAAMVIAIFSNGKVCFFSREPRDEMAEMNLNEARSQVLIYLQIGFCLAAGLLIMMPGFPFGLDINWRKFLVSAFFIMLGLTEIAVGRKFKKLEDQ